MQITLELSDEQSDRLVERARELSMQPEELVCTAVSDWLNESESEFQRIIERVMEKNRELYERLS